MNNENSIKRFPGVWWLTLLTSIILAAHFSRASEIGWEIGAALFPFLLLKKEKWLWQTMSIFLLAGSLIWIDTIVGIALIRIEMGKPWMRMVFILGSVVLLTLFTAYKAFKYNTKFEDQADSSARLRTIAFVATFISLYIIHLKAPLTIILADRLLPGLGVLEIFIISFYAGWLTGKILPKRETAKWRYRLWIFFSIVFFAQFLLGLTVSDIFMQTGVVHLPIPAVIIGGPLFRGEGFFMVSLLLITIILVGPSWCSHLCYVGAVDQYFSKKKKKSKEMPMKWRQNMRLGILLLTVAVGLLLNFLGASAVVASIVAIVFALISIAVMVIYSAKTGVMIHCTSICPVGWITTMFGKVNPFRIKINESCTDCGACTFSCRYGSLNQIDIESRKPNISCTLCGDCIGSCPHNSLEYQFVKMKAASARNTFLVLIITLHSIFLAVARV